MQGFVLADELDVLSGEPLDLDHEALNRCRRGTDRLLDPGEKRDEFGGRHESRRARLSHRHARNLPGTSHHAGVTSR